MSLLELRKEPTSPVVTDTAVAAQSEAAAGARSRISSIDLLRGLVMVLMALDHTRDFFSGSGVNPRDVADPALFLTRWITHLCAPTFIFLAGLSAYLYGARGKSTGEVSRFLFTRGFWLILIEFTAVRLGWTFSLDLTYFITQVIWALGASMVVLAALVYLPRLVIGALGLVMIAGHNLLDGVKAESFGSAGWIWNLLHEPALLKSASDVMLFAVYPLIPWVGVMAAGYAFGPIYRLEPEARRRWLLGLGGAITAGFVLLRASNVYCDPAPWTDQGDWLATVLAFLNAEKYPPSLLYLMMTLGPALLLLATFEGVRGRLADWVITFGRVPFLFYVLHLFWIHILAIAFAWATIGNTSWLFGVFPHVKPDGYGAGLLGVYAAALFVMVTLHPLCRRFAAVKQRRRDPWLSYL